MKHNKEKSFYDISYALTQLDVNNISEQEVDEALIGIDFNNVRDEEMLILSTMVNEGKTKAVKYLLNNGANPNLESSKYHYYKGAAILFALQNNRSKTEIKLEILKMLVEYGAEINSTVQWYDEELKKTIIGNYIEYGLKLGIENQKSLYGNFDSESIKDAKNEIAGLRVMLSFINKLEINISVETSRNLKDFLTIETRNKKEISHIEFYKEALEKLDVEDRVHDLPYAAKDICHIYLENENFMPSKEWGELIKHIINISLTFEEVAKEVYGEEYEEGLTIISDEGWLCQGWGNYTWFSELMEILSHKNSFNNPEWDNLLILVMKEHDKYSAQIPFEIVDELFEKPWVQSHPEFQKFKDIANQYL